MALSPSRCVAAPLRCLSSAAVFRPPRSREDPASANQRPSAMDLLQGLDDIDLESVDAGGQPGHDEVQARLDETPAKRRRTESEADTAGNESNASTLDCDTGLSGSPASELSRKDKHSRKECCAGCYRDPVLGMDFLIQGQGVTWSLPNSRGLWCKDCFTVWRTCFATSNSLTVFAQRLRSGEIRAEYDMHLAAYISLKGEGLRTITKEMVQGRVDALHTAMRLLCMPAVPSTVVPLHDLPARLSQQGQRPIVSGESLTTIQTPTGLRLAAFVPTEALDGSVVRRPVAGLPVIRQWLPAPSEASDLNNLVALFGGQPGMDAVVGASAVNALDGCGSSNETALVLYQEAPAKKQPPSKMQTKFEVAASGHESLICTCLRSPPPPPPKP